MKYYLLIILFLLISPSLLAEDIISDNSSKHEIQFRLAPQFGVLGKLNRFVTDYGVKKFVIIQPEVSLNVQIYKRWFASATFDYAKVRTKNITIPNIGPISTSADIYAITGGLKLVAWETNPNSKDFFDGTRWWLGLEAGDYITKASASDASSTLSESKTENSFGFNASTGFDYFFNENFGTGVQVKIHYVNFSLDDYVLFSFGPYLIVRF